MVALPKPSGWNIRGIRLEVCRHYIGRTRPRLDHQLDAFLLPSALRSEKGGARAHRSPPLFKADDLSTSSEISNSTIFQHTLDNGLTVLAEPMPWLRTAAAYMKVPAGAHWETDQHAGLAEVVAEMVQRGAGSRSSREMVTWLENRGIQYQSFVGSHFTTMGAAMPAESLPDGLSLVADIFLRPHLPADQLPDAKAMAMQELLALEDEPSQLLMERLRRLHFGPYWGRSSYGSKPGIEAITPALVRHFYERFYSPQQAVLVVAGNFSWPGTLQQITDLFARWPRTTLPEPAPPPHEPAAYEHIQQDSAQTHIGFAFPAVDYAAEDYFALRAGIGVLSDGMSSRLFDRVREQRGLCYSVSASCYSAPKIGGVFGYAGTTAQRAQETLDVTLAEIIGLAEGVEAEELRRLKVRVQSDLIMQQESCVSRAGSMASDWVLLGRVRSATELEQRIEAITETDIVRYWREHPPRDFRIVTLGPEPLRVPVS